MKKILLTPYNSHVIVTRTRPELERVYRRLTKKKLENAPHNAHGLTYTLEHKGCTDVYLVYAKSTSDLAHEFGHVILNLFKEIGCNPTEGNGEPFCYMLSHLMDEAKGA